MLFLWPVHAAHSCPAEEPRMPPSISWVTDTSDVPNSSFSQQNGSEYPCTWFLMDLRTLWSLYPGLGLLVDESASLTSSFLADFLPEHLYRLAFPQWHKRMFISPHQLLFSNSLILAPERYKMTSHCFSLHFIDYQGVWTSLLTLVNHLHFPSCELPIYSLCPFF